MHLLTQKEKVMKSYIPAANAPIRIDVPEGQLITANEPKMQVKRGRPVGSKDKNPRKRKEVNAQTEETITQEEYPVIEKIIPEESQVPENEEISINYILVGKKMESR